MIEFLLHLVEKVRACPERSVRDEDFPPSKFLEKARVRIALNEA